uniref:BTB/POZ domain-containing protein n=1 Tax=Panagrolaimus davidi TaxID=227884 RepID=A0A914QM55_9BILA
MIEYPFAYEWTIDEDRLKALKGSNNFLFLESERFTIFHGSDVQYYLRLYPNGDNDGRRGTTCVFLYLIFENGKKIQASYTFSIKSMNCSRNFNYIYENSDGCGYSVCNVNELFDSNEKFIHKGKFIVNVEGNLKIENVLTKQYFKHMTEYSFVLEWTISLERLKALKDSTKTKYLESEKYTAFHGSDVKYCLQLYPNGNTDACRGQVMIFLHMELENEKNVEADYKYSIANWSHKSYHLFEQSCGIGTSCCIFNELLNPKNKFIVDGKITVKVEGTLRTENTNYENELKLLQSKWKNNVNFGDLWKNDFKDCTFVSDGKEIKAHKCVISHYSPVFSAMLNQNCSIYYKLFTSAEKKICVTDFSLKTVEQFLKYCYNQNIVSLMSAENAILLLKFAEKYSVAELKKNLEEYLITILTKSIVCEVINCAIVVKSTKLQSKCLEYFVECLSKKEFVPNIKLLEKDFFISALAKLCCNQTEIDSKKDLGFLVTNWKTTKNFHDLWNIGHEDCTIIVDGKEISFLKVHKSVLAFYSPIFAEIRRISDFPFEIVEMAVKLCYHRSLVSNISAKDGILLLKFAKKYSIEMIKKNLEEYFCENLTKSIVCELINCTTDGNSEKLQKKCFEYFFQCLTKKEFVPKMELLEKEFLLKVISKLTCKKSQTL